MPRSLDRRVLYVLLVVPLLAVQGYRIRPFVDVHETMTRAARLCADRALKADTRPEDCYDLMQRPLGKFDLVARMVRWLRADRFPALEEASRWPDVPAGANASSLLDFMARCKDRIEERGGKLAHLNNGLLCNSHYGSMQFFHAQATELDESAVVTHDKIMAWAEFLFDIAVGAGPDPLETLYCDRFSGDGVFHQAMLPEDTAVACMDREEGPWRLTDLFTMKCRNPFDAETCDVVRSSYAEEIARINATGALLHLIQDSYSQSHAQRGTPSMPGGEVVPEVVCFPIRQFTNYVLQDGHEHARADGVPTLHPSCAQDTGIDDAVTASAIALWHIDRARSYGGPPTPQARAAFIRDLERVFSTREWIEENAGPTGPGDCCRKEAD